MGAGKQPDAAADGGSGFMRRGAAAYRHAAGNPPDEAPVFALSAETGAFFKTASGGKGDSKYRRVAKFLILIGSERAAEILARLDGEQVENISREITTIRSIGAEEGAAIIEEFRSLLSSPYGFAGRVFGGVEAARRLLYAAYGPEKGEKLLVRAVPGVKTNPLDFLLDFSGEQIALLFREEPAAAAALVFSQLPPKLSAAALAKMPGEKKLEVARRIARRAEVSPEVLEQVAAALREKARHLSAARDTGFDGINALAAILKSADAGFGDHLLRELENEDPGLGKNLKERIYTLDDIVYAADLPIQKKLAGMENREIILLLKARSRGALAGQNAREKALAENAAAAFREKILSNLSGGRREDLLEEEEITGPVPGRDVDTAASAFLAWFRENRDKGRIIMMNDTDVVR
ncbi:MAG: flagellar motor switch protein FliG [Treponema sp.]|jgi:flagellar motor switch protein FliG|nr:flagellar motor switch protein FliG [Treponema sp.]